MFFFNLKAAAGGTGSCVGTERSVAEPLGEECFPTVIGHRILAA